MKEDIYIMLETLGAFPNEIKALHLFDQKVELLDQLVEVILRTPAKDIDLKATDLIENLLNIVIGLAYSLDYIRGEISNLDSSQRDLLKVKLNRIGLLIFSLSKFYFPVISLKYLYVLRATRSLIYHGTPLFESLNLEIKIVTHELNEGSKNT